MRVISSAVFDRRTTPLEEAYAHFRLDRQGLPVSPATLRLYEHTIGRFLRWVRSEHPDVRRFEDLSVVAVREYRAALAARPGLRGRPIQPETLSGSDRALRTFFRWASAEGYPVAERILTLPKVRVPWKEPTLFHIRQVREILAACNPRLPQEAVAVRLLVGSGVRRLELCGLAVLAPSWRDVTELNARARERLADAGLVDREGLDVRGTTIGRGDQVMVLRNAPALGVINGTLATVAAIDRERGDLLLRTVEADPRDVRLPATFWNAKGRRRVSLAYCRTIHKWSVAS